MIARLDPSKGLGMPLKMLVLIGVIKQNQLFARLRLVVLIVIFVIPVCICYSWSTLYPNEYMSRIKIVFILCGIQGIAKFTDLARNQKKILLLTAQMNAINFHNFEGNHELIIEGALKFIKKIGLLFSSAITIAILAILIPWAIVLFNHYDDYPLFVDTWIPFEYSSSPLYELVVSVEIMGYISLGFGLVAVDWLVFALVYLIITQFEILNRKLLDIGHQKENCNVVFKNIKNCVVYNRVILENLEVFTKIFQVGLLAQISLSTVSMSASLFGVQEESRIFENVAVAVCVGFQIFLYCHLGQKLLDKTTELKDSAYFSNWHQFACQCVATSCEIRLQHERTFRRNVLFILTCVRPVELTAGKILVINHALFVKVRKTLAIVYTLLAFLVFHRLCAYIQGES